MQSACYCVNILAPVRLYTEQIHYLRILAIVNIGPKANKLALHAIITNIMARALEYGMTADFEKPTVTLTMTPFRV